MRAIGTRIVDGQTLTQSQFGLGDHLSVLAAGTAKMIGRGAGLLVSVPISVVDPATRRNLAGQTDALDKQFDETGSSGEPSGTGEKLLSGESPSLNFWRIPL